MDWLNYQHLYYFWAVAREESLTRAARRLRLAPSTISAQIRSLEADLEVELFDRSGRSLRVTEAGREALQFADEIFSLGQDLRQALAEPGSRRRPLRLRVGVADVMPKTVTWRLLEPLFARDDEEVQLLCLEGSPEQLGVRLAGLELDLVLTDSPVGLGSGLGVVSRLLGTSGVSLFASPGLAPRVELADGEPDLSGVPMLLPSPGSTLRRDLDRWLLDRQMRPRVVGEFDDSALLKTAAAADVGVFAMHSAAAEDLTQRLGFVEIAPLDGLSVRFYALTRKRQLTHPAVRRLLSGAVEALGGEPGDPSAAAAQGA